MNNEELCAAYQRSRQPIYLHNLWDHSRGYIYVAARSFFKTHECHCEFEDLTQQSYFAVQPAALRYDPNLGGNFLTLLGYYLLNEFQTAAQIRTKAQRKTNNLISYDVPLFNSDGEESGTLLDELEDTAATESFDAAEHRIFIQQLHNALLNLCRQLKAPLDVIMVDYYLTGKSVEQIAQERERSTKTIYKALRDGMRELQRKAYSPYIGAEIRQFVELNTNYYHGSAESIALRRYELEYKARHNSKLLGTQIT